MKTKLTFLLSIGYGLSSLTSCKTDSVLLCNRPQHVEPQGNISKIAFGSCSSQNKEQPILNAAAEKKNDLFVYLGDNIYGDTEDMNVLLAKYGKLSCKAEFQNLLNSCKVIATWDDHDYGVNDGGVEYSKKEESKNIFLDFWNEPKVSERRNHQGIYTSYYYGDSVHRVQIILLDLRTFRTPLITNANDSYIPNADSAATMLGAEQWLWLQNEFQQPAQIRIVGSSTQFGRSLNGYETWANFPVEQEKMFQTIRNAQANGVIFISGDVHLAELSKRLVPNLYPIYDLTSSGITQLEEVDIPNTYRVGNVNFDYNVGALQIDWSQTDPEIFFKIYGLTGNETYNHSIHLSEIHF